MNRSARILFVSVSLLFVVTGCKKINSSSESGSRPQTISPNEPQAAQGGPTAVADVKYFKGSIGSTLGLQMKLMREGAKLSGTYFYQKVGAKIELTGNIDANNNVYLEEFDSAGNKTGIFKGNWKTNAEGLIEIAGNWTRPDGSKATAFTLEQEPIDFTNGLEIIAKQVKENNKKLKYEIDAEYPELTGSTDPNVEKFNQLARNRVMKEVTSFRKSMSENSGEAIPAESETGSDLGVGYTIAIAQNDLISVQFDIGGYSAGAAHPNSYTDAINFDLSNGRQLRLSDLFKPGAKYLQAMSAYCIQDLKKQSKQKDDDGLLDDDWIQRGAGPTSDNYRSWTITKNGLGINFDSYQVAAYAAGPQYVLVPYQALQDVIRTDGPLGRFLK